MKIEHSIIIAAIIIGDAIVLSAFISCPSSGARYRAVGTGGGLILDTRTGDVQRTADKLENR